MGVCCFQAPRTLSGRAGGLWLVCVTLLRCCAAGTVVPVQHSTPGPSGRRGPRRVGLRGVTAEQIGRRGPDNGVADPAPAAQVVCLQLVSGLRGEERAG